MLRVWCEQNEYGKGEREDWILRTREKAYEFLASRQEERSASLTAMRDACLTFIDTLERGEMRDVRSGLAVLDDSIDGVAFGEMAVVAARPGHGKSALALQWLDNAAGAGLPGLILSEEMSALDLGKRGVAYASPLEQSEWGRDTADMLRRDVRGHYGERLPVYVVENCNTVDRAEDVIDQLSKDKGVRVVAVDYLQLLGGRGPKKYDQVSDVSRRLKQCARRTGVAMLALCQLNRDVDKRSGHEPELSDLRDTGQLEQDADLVLFLQWPHRINETADPNVYFIYAKKRRNGPIRRVKVETTFDPERQAIGATPARPASEVFRE